MRSYRVGFGFDVHRITLKKKNLILGGIKIPCSFGLEAISDGDVLLHAVSDALCGACGLGDIGDYFPPSSEFKDLDSKEIIRFILKKIDKKYRILNIDTIIVADKPKLSVHKKEILKSLKKILSVSSINVKVKSKEKLPILGAKNSISCFAIALVNKSR